MAGIRHEDLQHKRMFVDFASTIIVVTAPASAAIVAGGFDEMEGVGCDGLEEECLLERSRAHNDLVEFAIDALDVDEDVLRWQLEEDGFGEFDYVEDVLSG